MIIIPAAPSSERWWGAGSRQFVSISGHVPRRQIQISPGSGDRDWRPVAALPHFPRNSNPCINHFLIHWYCFCHFCTFVFGFCCCVAGFQKLLTPMDNNCHLCHTGFAAPDSATTSPLQTFCPQPPWKAAAAAMLLFDKNIRAPRIISRIISGEVFG